MTAQQKRALACLIAAPTRKEAAQQAGISERTLRTYLAQPDFRRAYEDAVQTLVDDATQQAQQALSPAITALRSIAEDTEQIPTARVSAARSLLEYGLRLTEINNILKELESAEGSGNDVL